ncbi:hypothetical protein V8C42DRAFT_126313 [Trichoderma barbatum]
MQPSTALTESHTGTGLGLIRGGGVCMVILLQAQDSYEYRDARLVGTVIEACTRNTTVAHGCVVTCAWSVVLPDPLHCKVAQRMEHVLMLFRILRMRAREMECGDCWWRQPVRYSRLVCMLGDVVIWGIFILAGRLHLISRACTACSQSLLS